MKNGDIVKFKLGVTEKMQKGKVNWVKEESVGITLIGDNYSGAEATVMPEKDCEVVVEYKGDELKDNIHGMETEDLKEAIQRLKGMRFPRKVKARGKDKLPRKKKQKLTKLLEELDGDPDALDALIDKALKEEKEEEKTNEGQ